MKTILLALALKLLSLSLPGQHLPATHPIMVRADEAAKAISEKVALVYGDLSAEEQEKRARVAYVWAFHESGWQANPKGSNDQGAAAGLFQVHVMSVPKGVLPEGFTASGIRADIGMGAEAGLRLIKYLEEKCGSLRAGMTAFSTNGSCPTKGWTITLVTRRCAEAGGC